MVDEAGDGNGGSIYVSHSSDCPRETKPVDKTVEGGDIISSMPHEILHRILSFIPTQYAIRTSALSKAWRHVWCHTPCLDFDNINIYQDKSAGDISQTLSSYRAPKITRFHLPMPLYVPKPEMNSWMEFVVSRNVEKLSLIFDGYKTRCFPNFFYRSSSLEKLRVNFDMIPGCTVSWKSLRKLTLSCCRLYDESLANILSGSPILETLELFYCRGPQRLDLSKSHSLRRLMIHGYDRGHQRPTEMIDDCDEIYQGPTEIVAPHIQYLILSSSYEPFTLVDVSCVTEASLDIYIGPSCYLVMPSLPFSFKADIFQTAVLKMLAKLQNAEKLSFTGTLLQILSLAQLRRVPFPTFKVQTLTLETTLARSVIPGITRLLHNSPGLKKLIVEASYWGDIEDSDIYSYLESQGVNPDQRFHSYAFFPTKDELYGILSNEESSWELVALFVEMMLINVTTLETLVVGLKCIDPNFNDAKLLEDLLQILPTLLNNNNVSIVLKR